MPDQCKHVYFVGIGGVGMSALAQILIARGVRVSGSDPQQNESTDRLQKMGAQVFREQGGENIERSLPDLVVVTAAVRDNHPEVSAAKAAKIPVVSRAEFLAEVMGEKAGPRIAVTGTHGKTTTTAMIATVLIEGNLNPTVLVGGELASIGGNVRVGGDPIVVEACEAFESFLWLRPDIAVLTNVEADHLDYYGTIERVYKSFATFLSGINAGGSIVWCGDDPGARQVLRDAGGSISAPTLGYGIAKSDGADIWADDIEPMGLGHRFQVKSRDCAGVRVLGEVTIQVPGLHNVQNAMAAAAVGTHLGIPWDQIASALSGFRGAGRRFEVLGEVNGVLVIDDYAHHPTEVRATIRGARAAYPGRRIISVFQPHLYSRTRDHLAEFADALNESDAILVTDIYAAREDPIPGVQASDLVREIAGKTYDKTVMYLPDKNQAAGALDWITIPGDIVLTLGAGDINQVAEQFLRSKPLAA